MKSKTAIKIMLMLLLAVVIFHLCIIVKMIPYDIAWGGRLKSDSQMYFFETVSIVVNLFLIFILLIKGHFIQPILPIRIVNICLWIFLVLFVLNTIGNIIAKTNFEKYFAILTLAFSYLIWIILSKKEVLISKQ